MKRAQEHVENQAKKHKRFPVSHCSSETLIPAELLKTEKTMNTYFVPKPQFATAKANLRSSAAAASRTSKKTIDLSVAINPYIDKGSLGSRINDRAPRALKFNNHGKFVEAAEKQRAEIQIAELKRKIAESARKAGLDMEVVMDIAKTSETPEAEWWDEQFLPSGSYKDIEGDNISFEFVKKTIQRPALIKKPGDDDQVSIPLYLTKDERKKIRRQRRLEEQKEKQEKIMLGLIPEPEQKLKMSTFMKVLANQAIQDPTKMEEIVKQQAQKRLEEHVKANEDRKLTPEEKAAKIRAKLKADLDAGIESCIFLINRNSISKKQTFKIEVNAKQTWLGGYLAVCPSFSFILVQGGKKSIKKYKKLIMSRINVDEDEDEAESNPIVLVWEGSLPNKDIRTFETKQFDSEFLVEEFMESQKLLQYWKIIRDYQKSVQ